MMLGVNVIVYAVGDGANPYVREPQRHGLIGGAIGR